MVTFCVIVRDVMRDRTTQRSLPDEDHPIQAFVFYRANKALGVSVQIGVTSVAAL